MSRNKIYTTVCKVQFEEKTRPGKFAPQEYSYIAEVPVEIGDLVVAPTRYGDRTARVSRTRVPRAEWEKHAHLLRHITRRKKVKEPKQLMLTDVRGAGREAGPTAEEQLPAVGAVLEGNTQPLPF